MKGKKMVFAVILSLIVCLLLVPSAYAEEQPTENNSEEEIVVNNNPTNPDGDNGGSDNDSQNNESTDKPADSADSESKNDSDNDSTSDDEGQSGVNDDSSDESKDNTGSDDDTDDDSDTDTDTDESDNDTDSEEEESDTDSEEKEQENASEEETETDSAPTHTGDSNLPPQPESTFLVELKYNGTSHKLDNLKGNEQFDLAEILGALGIPAGSIDTVQSGNDELFSAENGENGWLFTTKKAFTSEETLTVVVDGVAYVLQVIDDETVYNAKDLQDKLDKATDGVNHIIKIGGNIKGNFTIEANKVITIDLNGKTLSNPGENTGATLTNNGTLIIKDSSPDKKGTLVTYGGASTPALCNNGTATVESGTLTRISRGSPVLVNYGKITFKDGSTLDANGICYTVIDNFKDGEIIVDGGVFKNQHTTGDYDRLFQNRGTVTINGGTFEKSGNGCIIGNYSSSNFCGKTTINGGTFNTKDNKYNIFAVGDDAITIVESGIFGDASALEFVGDDTVIIKSGNLYAVNESGYELAKSGNTVEIVKAPANSKIDNVPAGVTIINNTGSSIIINGVEVAPGESYTTPAPANTITLTNDAPVIKYWVVEGKDQTWTKSGNESIVFTLNSSAVTKVLVDGVEVEFEVDEDGKIVISAEVLEALEAGEHTVEFIFADGNCKTNIIIK